MGVRGLKTFIELNDDLLIKDHRLQNTCVVVDACNLIGTFNKQSQQQKRRNLSGGHLVEFGRLVKGFFGNLGQCNVKPILVFDSAQTRAWKQCKTHEVLNQAAQEFQDVLSIDSKFEPQEDDNDVDDSSRPHTVNHVFKSVAFDNELTIVQCKHEADAEIARLSQQLHCPVISNDSDFYLMDLSFGVIPIDFIDYKRISRRLDSGDDDERFIKCCIFKIENFTAYFPGLDKRNLPLLGVLAGNDYVQAKRFERVCSQLPSRRIFESCGLKSKQFRKISTKQHQKIIKILYFLCSRTLNEAINQLCHYVPKEERKEMKDTIKVNLAVYDVPQADKT